VLFDSRALHSFISNTCVGRLGLEVSDLGCELVVSTSASGQVTTNSNCDGCSIEVVGRKFKVNLICFPLKGLDVILGMNWLSNNHVVIDCGWGGLVFPKTEGVKLISTQEVMKELRDGTTCFMMITQLENKSNEEQIRSIHVVVEFADVFPNKVPGLPPSRDVNFTIDLILGVDPVLVAPYRMAPTELAELKKQIEDLLEKKFIRPSASLSGAPMLLLKKKDGSSRHCVDYSI